MDLLSTGTRSSPVGRFLGAFLSALLLALVAVGVCAGTLLALRETPGASVPPGTVVALLAWGLVGAVGGYVIGRQSGAWIAERERREQAVGQAPGGVGRARDRATAIRIAAGLSHEFNNPLAIIKGYADLMLLRYCERLLRDPNGLPELVPYLRQVQEGAERCESVVEQMMMFADPFADYDRGTYDVNDAIRAAVASKSGGDDAGGVRLCTALDSELPLVAGNVELMALALGAIIANAIDAGPPEGCVRITSESVDGPGDARHVRATVDDEGPGISVADLPRIFEPFFSSKEVGEGMGFGLSVAEAIVHGHGGWISASNRPEGGARIVVDLPETGAAEESELAD